MIIQCREDLFNKICDFILETTKLEPYIVASNDLGYINCFDKDWVFIKLEDSLLDEFALKEATQYIIGISTTNTIIQKNISEEEKYIFIRKINKEYEMLWGVSSYIKFK